MPSSLVTLSHVDQGYGTNRIISDFNLALGPGVVGLLGPNGAGKTTLIRTMATLSPPRGGSLYISGSPVGTEREARNARKRLGYLAQNFGYAKNFTSLDFILYCLWLRGYNNPAPRDAKECLNQTGMLDNANTKMKHLSGGMRQRVGISSAIAGSPQVILLDEPTVGLDPAQRLQFRRLIKLLSSEACVVLSTHLIEDVAAACDSVVVMDKGNVKFSGVPDKLEQLAAPEVPGDSLLEKGYMTVLEAEGNW